MENAKTIESKLDLALSKLEKQNFFSIPFSDFEEAKRALVIAGIREKIVAFLGKEQATVHMIHSGKEQYALIFQKK